MAGSHATPARAGRREPDWVIDAGIALYKGRGWSWEEIGAFFGMSAKSAKRRCERYEKERGKRDGKPVEG